MRWVIERKWPKDKYIIGRMYIDDVFYSNTLERPDLSNKPNISCIPKGMYEVKLTYSSKFKRKLPLVMDVPGRSGIRFHKGNYVRDTEGCILIGENSKVGTVLRSGVYEDKLVRLLELSQAKGEVTILTII